MGQRQPSPGRRADLGPGDRRYLRQASQNIEGPSAAPHLRLHYGAVRKISVIPRKLGHKSIATTSLYLLTLTSEENPYAEVIEQAIGVDER